MNNSRKKILVFATTYLPFIGGAEITVQEITKRITDVDFDIVTVDLDGKQIKTEVMGNVTIHRIGSGRLGKLFFPIRAFVLGSKLNRKNKYDAFWSVMASYAGFAGLLFSYRHPRIPFVLTLQEGDTKEELRAKFQFVWFLFKKIFKRATMIQAISGYLAEFAIEIDDKATVVVIPNGVDVDRFNLDVSGQVREFQRKYQKGPKDIFLVTTSRLVRKNAVRDIIVSLINLPKNIKLLIVGDGQLRKDLEAGAIKDNVIDRVIFAGEVPHDLVLAHLKISEIFVRPSLSEGFGNSFVEAMAAGLPVVATPVGGIVDFISDRKTGVFCKVNNPEDLAQKVLLLIENSDLKDEIVQNASDLVREKYNWSLIAERMKKEVFDVVWE